MHSSFSIKNIFNGPVIFFLVNMYQSNEQFSESYLNLCSIFAEKAKDAQSYLSEEKEDDINVSFVLETPVQQNLKYEWIAGKRDGSELLWASSEQMIYMSNAKILVTDNSEAYTCYDKKCTARVHVRPDGFAYKKSEHTVAHGSMYDLFIELKCRNTMKDDCKTAPASKTVTDIYNDAIMM